MSDLYREIILEHYKNPQNKGKLLKPDIITEDENPLCGDQLEIHMRIKQDVLEDISFEGKGCALSIATSSILTEELKGKKIEDIKKMTREDVYALIGIDVTPARNKCVMLPLTTIKQALQEGERSE